jgi:hypothetical protein
MSPITDWTALAADAKDASKGFEPAPDGNYNLTITEAVVTVAKDSGNTKFDTTMVIDAGPYKNKKVWHSFTVAKESKKALSIFFQNMNVFGMPIDFFGPQTQDEQIRQNLVGKRLSADLIVDTYNPDKPKNKIDKGWSIKAPTAPAEIDPMTANNANSGIPGGAPMAATNAAYQAPAPVNENPWETPGQSTPAYQQPNVSPVQPQPMPTQHQQAPPPPQQYSQQAPPPPPPPPGANWGAPPAPPPGLS